MNKNLSSRCLLRLPLSFFTSIIFLLFTSFSVHATLIQTLFINELHYDNTGADTGEFIELAGTAGQDLKDWAILFYNGNGKLYKGYKFKESLLLHEQSDGFGFISVAVSGIQNGTRAANGIGDKDGIALISPTLEVIQFLSYEGRSDDVITAVDGLAQGKTSTNIGVYEPDDTPLSYSLQLGGQGNSYENFTWQMPQSHTPGTINHKQFITTSSQRPNPVPEPASIFLILPALYSLKRRQAKICLMRSGLQQKAESK